MYDSDLTDASLVLFWWLAFVGVVCAAWFAWSVVTSQRHLGVLVCG